MTVLNKAEVTVTLGLRYLVKGINSWNFVTKEKQSANVTKFNGLFKAYQKPTTSYFGRGQYDFKI
jgi:hypothetical protein